MKQIKFHEVGEDIEIGGILLDDGNIVCGCCGCLVCLLLIRVGQLRPKLTVALAKLRFGVTIFGRSVIS